MVFEDLLDQLMTVNLTLELQWRRPEIRPCDVHRLRSTGAHLLQQAHAIAYDSDG